MLDTFANESSPLAYDVRSKAELACGLLCDCLEITSSTARMKHRDGANIAGVSSHDIAGIGGGWTDEQKDGHEEQLVSLL